MTRPDADEADWRRAISASYYAVFNALTLSASGREDAPAALRHRLRRTFGHSEVAKVCSAYIKTGIGAQGGYEFIDRPSPELVSVAKCFVELRDNRERADYDLAASITKEDAISAVVLAVYCLGKWNQHVATTPEGVAFSSTLQLFGRRRG